MEKIEKHWYKIKNLTDPLGEKEKEYLKHKYKVFENLDIRKDDGYYFVSWSCDFKQDFYRNKFEDFSEMIQYLDIIDILHIISDSNSEHKLIVSKVESLLRIIRHGGIKFDLEFDDSIIRSVIRRLSRDPSISGDEFPTYDRNLRDIRKELEYRR